MTNAAIEAAQDWLLELNENASDPRIKARFSAWYQASPDHAAAFGKVYDTWTLIVGSDAALAELNRILDVEAAPKAEHSRSWLKVAAGIAAFAVFAGASAWQLMQDRPETQVYRASHQYIDRIMLADGSTVTLRPNSSLEVTLAKDTRRIMLRRGRAFFDVAPDETRPFVVTAGKTAISVLGTAFDVKQSTDGVLVTVQSGKVSVADLKDELSSTEVEDTIELSANMQVRAGSTGTLSERMIVDSSAALGWMVGRLVYDDARLPDIISDLNAYRSDTLKVVDPALADIRITTSFTIEQADQVLNTLAEAYGIAFLPIGDEIRLSAKPR
ncbi:MAG: FecR domain-containing protein [Pseudomonadota bacterium]